MSKIKPCITHSKGIYWGRFRLSYLSMCKGNIRAAQLLDYLEFTHSMRLAKLKNISKEVREMNPEKGLWQYQTDGWVFNKTKIPEGSIGSCFKLLEEEGLIKIWSYQDNKGKNPSGNFNDRKRWILFNREIIQEKVTEFEIEYLDLIKKGDIKEDEEYKSEDYSYGEDS